jgi:tetratricopeptide (TPR) repeat protein
VTDTTPRCRARRRGVTPPRLTVALLLALLARWPTAAQDGHAAHDSGTIPREVLERPIALRRGIGTVHEAVSTRSREAQAFYDQGLAYLHSFVWIEAARSFHQALRSEPRLAMAYLGLSIAEWQLNRPDAARTALARARALSDGSERERRRVELREIELDAVAHAGDAARLGAYRRALDDSLAREPLDVELWLLRGMAEARVPGDRGQGSPAGSIAYYQKVLALEPDSMPAHHYLTHACESSGRIDEALAHATTYARLAPAIPHAHHMHGHDLRRTGRIDDAIAEFQTAYDIELEDARAERIPIEYDWHHQHNLDLLATSLQYIGQIKAAERFFRAAFAMPSPLIVEAFAKREWPEFLIERGRWADASAAAAAMAAHASPIVSATGHIMAGRALLGAGRWREAAIEANTALRLLRTLSANAGLVAPSFEQLQGEYLLRTGQQQKGRAMLDGVVTVLRGQPGPDEWTQALFALSDIARTAREAGDWEFAGRIAGQMLAHDPWYAGTHFALALVAVHDGRADAAEREFTRAETLWTKADADLPERQVIARWRQQPPPHPDNGWTRGNRRGRAPLVLATPHPVLAACVSSQLPCGCVERWYSPALTSAAVRDVSSFDAPRPRARSRTSREKPCD